MPSRARHAITPGEPAPLAVAPPRAEVAPGPLRAPAPGEVATLRVALPDGAATTVHVLAHDLARTRLRVAVPRGQRPLEAICAARGARDGLVGGFFTRASGLPLGEVRTGGVLRRHAPFAQPWASTRACVHVEGGRVRIAPRDALPALPRGDLLQAGPLLVADGRVAFRREEDREGFSAGAGEFDSDITAERHPRAALALAEDRLLAVAVDGRAAQDAGLTLEELARVLVALGARSALNLDGGGSASLVAGGRLRNVPRAAWGRPEPGGRPISSALLFAPR